MLTIKQIFKLMYASRIGAYIEGLKEPTKEDINRLSSGWLQKLNIYSKFTRKKLKENFFFFVSDNNLQYLYDQAEKENKLPADLLDEMIFYHKRNKNLFKMQQFIPCEFSPLGIHSIVQDGEHWTCPYCETTGTINSLHNTEAIHKIRFAIIQK